MKNRIEQLRNRMKSLAVDAVYITSDYNYRYFSGFTGSSAYVLITAENAYLLTDFRYIEQANEECEGFEILDYYSTGGLEKNLRKIFEANNIKRIGFEDNQVKVSAYNKYIDLFHEMEFQPLGTTLEYIRQVKDEVEIETIQKAAKIGDDAFLHILNFLKPGVTEKEVAVELEHHMRKSGASKLSFDTIVASGERSSLPHAQPTDRKLQEGDFVTMDFGCIYNGYCSDMTRTVVIGKASEKQKEIYNIVLKAQKKALENIKAGVKGKIIDGYARDIIDEAGYRKNFGHGLGHGLGLEVHESPRFSILEESIIRENVVMSVEPGIYIEGFGGVRIEDLVLVTKDGIRNFVTSPKELIEIEIE